MIIFYHKSFEITICIFDNFFADCVQLSLCSTVTYSIIVCLPVMCSYQSFEPYLFSFWFSVMVKKIYIFMFGFGFRFNSKISKKKNLRLQKPTSKNIFYKNDNTSKYLVFRGFRLRFSSGSYGYHLIITNIFFRLYYFIIHPLKLYSYFKLIMIK